MGLQIVCFSGGRGGVRQSLELFFQRLGLKIQSLGLIFQSLGLKFRIKQYKEKWLFLSFSARLALPLPPLGVTQSLFGAHAFPRRQGQLLTHQSNSTIMAYVISDDCIACGTCIDECPSGAISEGAKYSIDPSVCVDCGTCADVCPSGAIAPGE